MGAQERVLGCLSKDSFWMVNKKLLEYTETCDFDAVMLLTELLSEYVYYFNTNTLSPDGYFYSTVKNISKHLKGMSVYRQRSAIDRLEAYHFIFTSSRGMPKKRYFKINFEAIEKAFDSIKEEVLLPKTDIDMVDYYNTINNSMEVDSYEVFLTKVGNMKIPLAFSIYYWAKLYQSLTKYRWFWTQKSLGIFRIWVYREIRTGPIDYSIFKDYFESIKKVKNNQEKEIGNFVYWTKEQTDKSLSERKTGYQELLAHIGG